MNLQPAKSILHWCVLLWGCLLAAIATAAWADQDADKAAISLRLHAWAAAFNARDAAGTCALFAPNLVSTVQGAPNAGRDVVCARLARMLARPEMRLHYSPQIQEIIISCDIAVVRLIWTLTTQQEAGQHSSEEAGMDVFQRQADGKWSIIRFVAFPIELE